MKLAVTYPDVEHLVVDYLTAALEALGEPATVAVGVPINWTAGDHLQVSLDGTPTGTHPVIVYGTVRLTAWASNTTRAKRLAGIAQGLLLAHPGGREGIATATFLTGVLPARDPKTQAELASTTSRVGVRSVPIEPSGS